MRGLSALLAAAAVVVGSSSCRGGSPTPTPAVSSVPSVPNGPAEVARAAGAAQVPALHVVLDDPRAAPARELERAKDFAGAARAFDEAHRGLTLGADVECAWTYVSGRLHLAASELDLAAAAFDQAACTKLGGYASLRASQAYARAGRADDAILRARAVPGSIAQKDEAKLVLAEALAAKGDRAAALPMWRALLGASPHGVRWVDTAVRVATAVLDGVDGDASSHAREAYDLATRVVVEAPKLADVSGAQSARSRAAALLRTADPTFESALSTGEHARIAQAWLDAGEPARALTEANAILHAAPKTPAAGGAQCKAAIVRANATAKTHGPTADAWTDAIGLCAGDDALVVALYSGGKASLAAKRVDEGVDRLGQLEQLFPKHRLADDARFHAALALRDAGDEPRASAMLTTLVDDYPEGDMRAEALFRVALARMAKGDWAAAKEPLERAAALDPNDRHWGTAARALYFRARVSAAAGDTADARARYAEIVASYPLAFYMTQAYARLASEDAALAKRTMDEAIVRDTQGAFPARDHAEIHTPAFERACALLEVGEVDSARTEMGAAGALSDGVDPEMVWTVGLLYNRAGAPELGHSFARARVKDHLPHYPVGRWRVPWEVAFPRAFESLVRRESTANAIPASLTWAIMREESDFYAEAKSPSNAYGLMQLIVPTAQWMAKGTAFGADEASLKRPEVSVAFGTKLLGQLRGTFAVNPALAIAAYNGGGGAVGRWVTARSGVDFDLWVEQIPWEETRGYIKRVVASEAAYAFLYEQPALGEVLGIPTRVSK